MVILTAKGDNLTGMMKEVRQEIILLVGLVPGIIRWPIVLLYRQVAFLFVCKTQEIALKFKGKSQKVFHFMKMSREILSFVICHS